MRKYLLPFFLIVTGLCLTVLSARSDKKAIQLTEVSGSISDHTSSDNRSTFRPHYFWLRGYACTFIIPIMRASHLDASVFNRSFQDTTVIHVKIPMKRKNDLQVQGAVIPAEGLRSDVNVYLEESDNITFRFKPGLLFTGICLLLAALILLIIYLVKEVRSY
jgi:hypothetical protein